MMGELVRKIKKFFYFKHSKVSLLTTILIFAIASSIFKLLFADAATPNPGHSWAEVGDGNFAVAGLSSPRTFTLPDASATILTTNSLVTVAQGGTGTSSLSGVLIGNGTSAVTATTSPDGLLVGTTANQSLTNKTIAAASNTITDTSAAVGDLFRFDGTRFARFARGGASQLLRVNAGGTDLEWVGGGTSAAGSDQDVQINSGGSFGSTTSLAWDNGNQTLKLAGVLELATSTTPSVAATGTMKIANNEVAGRNMILVRTHVEDDSYFLQPSLFQNYFVLVQPKTSATISSFGASLATNGTVTTVINESNGIMSDLVTAASANANAQLGFGNQPNFYMGNQSGFNGFFFFARVNFPDTSYNWTSGSTGSRLGVGMGDQFTETVLDTSNSNVKAISFSYVNLSTESNNCVTRKDTAWKIVARNGNLNTCDIESTGMTFATSTVYDMYLYCPAQCSTIAWRIDDLTNGTSYEGLKSSGLPTSTFALTPGIAISTINATARHFRFQKLYTESSR